MMLPPVSPALRGFTSRSAALRLSYVAIYLAAAGIHSAVADAASTPNAPGHGGVNRRLSDYVDPFIGTSSATVPGTISGSGNFFPGAAVPFGMVKVGIDTAYTGLTVNVDNINAGYSPNGNLTGISLMHVSGTGGPPKYGVVSQMPLTGSLEGINLADNTTYFQNRSLTEEVAKVGYFKTKMLNDVQAEMTATQHAAHLRYTFPADQDAHILIDLGHVIPAFNQPLLSQRYRGGALYLTEDGQSYSGYASYTGGWNEALSWKIYFCANFTAPATSFGTFAYAYDYIQAPEESPIVRPYLEVSAFDTYGLGALFTWSGMANTTLESRAGISFISREKACRHVSDELPKHTSFEDTMNNAKDLWEDEVLSSITIPKGHKETNETLLTLMYTALYGTAVMPSDRSQENPGWKSSEPYYDDIYTFWDIYHCTTPLWHLIYTPRYVDIIRGLIDIWRHDGFLPDGRSTNFNGKTQGGSDVDQALADAYIKGFDSVESINWHDAFAAMQTNAEKVPFRNLDPDAFDGGTKEGRIALPDWHKYGYISPVYSRSVSKTLEYSQNDFGLYQVAKGMGKVAEASLYLNRSQNFRNLFNPNASADLSKINAGTFHGFMAPRNQDGSWNQTFNITNCGGCSWNDLTYEGLLYEYVFDVPHDIAGLIDLFGGSDEFLRRLDAAFIPGFTDVPSGSVGSSNGAGTSIYNPGNEVSFLTPLLYNYVSGQQHRTVDTVRSVLGNFYSIEATGYPGNTDAGAMESWLLWNLIGLFPVTAQPVYLISSPHFSAIDVRLKTGMVGRAAKKEPVYLSIRADGLSNSSYYIQSVTLDGKPITRSWIHHSEIKNGATLRFKMGPKPKSWDVGELPPSYSRGSFKV